MRAEKCLRVRCEHTPHKHHQLLCSLQRSPGSLTWREELTWAARFQQPPPLSFFQLDNQAAPAFIESRCSGKGLKKKKNKKTNPCANVFSCKHGGGWQLPAEKQLSSAAGAARGQSNPEKLQLLENRGQELGAVGIQVLPGAPQSSR